MTEHVHFEEPDEMRGQCAICFIITSENNPVRLHTVRCEYRPRAKDVFLPDNNASIAFSLCREHDGAKDAPHLNGWDWWDILDSMLLSVF
jgi:hypothetical protein